MPKEVDILNNFFHAYDTLLKLHHISIHFMPSKLDIHPWEPLTLNQIYLLRIFPNKFTLCTNMFAITY